MGRPKKNSIKNPITMPVGFYDFVFTPSLDRSIIKKAFSGNQSHADDFVEIFKAIAKRLSDDFLDDDFLVAIAKGEDGSDSSNFFLYPKDDDKVYRINGEKIPSQNDIGHCYVDEANRYDHVFVDNKVFGLIATLCTFDDYWQVRDIPVEAELICDVYMDRGQDLNEIILEVIEELKIEAGGRRCAMMNVVWLFLRPRCDESGQSWHPFISYH